MDTSEACDSPEVGFGLSGRDARNIIAPGFPFSDPDEDGSRGFQVWSPFRSGLGRCLEPLDPARRPCSRNDVSLMSKVVEDACSLVTHGSRCSKRPWQMPTNKSRIEATVTLFWPRQPYLTIFWTGGKSCYISPDVSGVHSRRQTLAHYRLPAIICEAMR